MSKIFYTIIFIAIVFFLNKCARIGTIEGGPRDTAPPYEVESIPKNRSVEVDNKKFEITFNEYIELKNANKEIVVSPFLEENPIYRVRNKTVIVDINNDLLENTTYTINFGNSIVDYTENNPISNYEYVFSTGSYLDSLTFSGKIVNAQNLKPPENPVFVILYDNLSDTAPVTTFPKYIGKTDKKGMFEINNIVADTFKVFALADANNNFKYDMYSEPIAFIDSAFIFDLSQISPEEIVIKDSSLIEILELDTNKVNNQTIDSIISSTKMVYGLYANLFLFEETLPLQYISERVRSDRNKIIFTFNEPIIDSVLLKSIDFPSKIKWFLKERTTDNKELTIWINDSVISKIDTLNLETTYNIYDSIGNIILQTDTFLFRYTEPKEIIKRPRRKKDKEIFEDTIQYLKIKVNTSPTKKMDLNNLLILETETPVLDYNLDSIKLYQVQDSIEKQVSLQYLEDTGYFRKFYFQTDWQEGSLYKLQILPKAFKGIYRLTNDTLTTSFYTQSLAYYGTITCDVSNVKTSVIIQLLDEKENLVKDKIIRENERINFTYLNPGSYMIKAIYDTNKNNKWDSGNYLEKKQPEKVSYHKETIKLRSNFDIEQDWQLDDEISY